MALVELTAMSRRGIYKVWDSEPAEGIAEALLCLGDPRLHAYAVAAPSKVLRNGTKGLHPRGVRAVSSIFEY
jgi:hypothetical protein